MSRYRSEHFVDRTHILDGFARVLNGEREQVVLAVQAPIRMGKSWLALKLRDMCVSAATTPPVALIDFRNERQQATIRQRRLLAAHLRDLLHADGVWTPFDDAMKRAAILARSREQAAAVRAMGPKAAAQRHLNELAHRIEDNCTSTHLMDLCARLGLVFDHFYGSVQFQRLFTMVDQLHREGRILHLFDAIEEVHPKVAWREGMELVLKGPSDDAETMPTTMVADNDERAAAERVVSDSFFECLTALVAKVGPVVVILDALECDEDVLAGVREWLTVEFIGRISDGELPQVHLLLFGRELPDMTAFGLDGLLFQRELKPFSEEDIETYFEECRKIDLGAEKLEPRGIRLLSGGLPSELAKFADRVAAKQQLDDPFFSDPAHE